MITLHSLYRGVVRFSMMTQLLEILPSRLLKRRTGQERNPDGGGGYLILSEELLN